MASDRLRGSAADRALINDRSTQWPTEAHHLRVLFDLACPQALHSRAPWRGLESVKRKNLDDATTGERERERENHLEEGSETEKTGRIQRRVILIF